MGNLAKRLIATTTPLAFITSVTYLFVYWFTFKINIFDYLQISELIVFSIMPFFASIGALVGCALFYYLLYPFIMKATDEKNLESKWFKRVKKGARFVSGGFFLFFILWIMVAIPLGIGFLEFLEKWESHYRSYVLLLLAPLLLAIFFTEILDQKGFGNSLTDNETIRKAILFLVIFLPLEAAAYGKVSADMLKYKRNYPYVQPDLFPKDLNLKSDEHMRYIGKASNYFFFLMPDKETIVIIKDNQILPFKLQRHHGE